MYKQNLSLLTDFYQLSMMNGYFVSGMKDKLVIFDLFYRKNPFENGYAIFAGLDSVIDYIKNINFSDEDIQYLKSVYNFDKDFLSMLKYLKFTGDIISVKEGSVVFPNEPLLIIKSNILEAQLIESTLLNLINHQSLIATKSSRINFAAQGDKVLELGLRRAHGSSASIYGSRSAIIGGCSSSSNLLAGKMFNIPVSGTMSHSWVMNFKDELTSFRTYAKSNLSNLVLLVDTYNTVYSGIPNAIKVFNELAEWNILPEYYGIRLDSGDLSYLSKVARKMLDQANHKKAFICASNDLDEHIITTLKSQGSKIDVWGIGTNLITSMDCPSFGGVYKLSAEINDKKEIIPKIKISENVEKVTIPGSKKVYRIFDVKTKKIKADLITLENEKINNNEDLTIFHPNLTWKKMVLKAGQYYVEDLHEPIFINGDCVYNSPNVMDIQLYCKQQLASLWEEHKRLANPEIVPVDLSKDLWELRNNMINKNS